MENLSLGDALALTRNSGSNGEGSGFFNGNGDWAWIIILFLLFGWGRNGFGGNGGYSDGNGGCCNGGFGAPNIYGKLDGITYGISDATFALNNNISNGFTSVQSALCQGFNGVNQAIATNGYESRLATQGLSSQLANCCCDIQRQIADCCCENRAATADLKYTLATESCATRNIIQNTTRDILENNNNNTRAILDFLTNDKISTLTAENQALRFQASQSAQNAFITANQEAQTAELIRRLGADCPVPAYVVPNPNCCYDYQVTRNTGCGCACN